MKLQPVSYEYTDYGQKGISYNGFIAQEVEKILDANGWQFSGLCKPANEKDRYSIRYAEFVVPLVNAVQEQQLVLEKYQAELIVLRNENQALKNNYQTLSNQFTDLQKQLDELKMIVLNNHTSQSHSVRKLNLNLISVIRIDHNVICYYFALFVKWHIPT